MKLAAIDPATLTSNVVKAFDLHLRELGLAAPTLPALFADIERVITYAKVGAHEGLATPDDAERAVRRLAVLAFAAPLRPIDGPTWWHEITNDTPLGVVLRAALVRVWLARGEAVPAALLADARSCSTNYLRQLASEGRIDRVSGRRGVVIVNHAKTYMVTHESAARLLGASSA